MMVFVCMRPGIRVQGVGRSRGEMFKADPKNQEIKNLELHGYIKRGDGSSFSDNKAVKTAKVAKKKGVS